MSQFEILVNLSNNPAWDADLWLVGVTPTRSTWLLLLIAFTCFSFVLTDNTVWLPSGQQMILEQATSCIDNDPQSLVLSWLVGFSVLINSSFHSSVLGMKGKLLCNWNHYKICMSADMTVQPAERLWLSSPIENINQRTETEDLVASCLWQCSVTCMLSNFSSLQSEY